MATTESARHQLYRRISEVIGSDEADTLMELLPPVGWADVATKSDLAHLAERTDLRFDAIDRRFDAVDQRFEQVDRRFEQMEGRFATQASLDEFRIDMDRRFTEFAQSIGWRFEAVEARMLTGFADLRTELHRSLRVNLIVTIGFLGTLVAVVGALTS